MALNDHDLFNSFMLNEIEGKDAALRYLMGIDVILIGAYVITLANLFGNLGIKLIDSDVHLSQILPFNVNIAIASLMSPIFLWIISTYIIVTSFGRFKVDEKIFNPSKSATRLIEINEIAYFRLKWSSVLTLTGLVIVLLLVTMGLGWIVRA